MEEICEQREGEWTVVMPNDYQRVIGLYTLRVVYCGIWRWEILRKGVCGSLGSGMNTNGLEENKKYCERVYNKLVDLEVVDTKDIKDGERHISRDLSCAIWYLGKVGNLEKAMKALRAADAALKEME